MILLYILIFNQNQVMGAAGEEITTVAQKVVNPFIPSGFENV